MMGGRDFLHPGFRDLWSIAFNSKGVTGGGTDERKGFFLIYSFNHNSTDLLELRDLPHLPGALTKKIFLLNVILHKFA